MKSPCTNICVIDRPTGLCVGCGRSLSEIGEWASAIPERKQQILSALPERMLAVRKSQQVMAAKGKSKSR
ncbi:MAG: DUF1289 domain-containing protein [Parasphingorhabdus sp.]|uniref:DUF1289 domain-containing protein n=1 Tax=Parasphingorhabdus sp. TaxID=2709688 RepID=UPI0032997D05